MNYDTYLSITLFSIYVILTVCSLTPVFISIKYLNGYRIEGGVIVHYSTRQQIKKLEKQIETLEYNVQYLKRNMYVHRNKHVQLTYMEKEKPHQNKHNLVLPFPLMDPRTKQEIIVTCRGYLDRVYMSRGTHIWIERIRPSIGKRTSKAYDYMWIPAEEFNPKTDWDVLKYFPYTTKNHDEYIPERCLPFTWEYRQIKEEMHQ